MLALSSLRAVARRRGRHPASAFRPLVELLEARLPPGDAWLSNVPVPAWLGTELLAAALPEHPDHITFKDLSRPALQFLPAGPPTEGASESSPTRRREGAPNQNVPSALPTEGVVWLTEDEVLASALASSSLREQ